MNGHTPDVRGAHLRLEVADPLSSNLRQLSSDSGSLSFEAAAPHCQEMHGAWVPLAKAGRSLGVLGFGSRTCRSLFPLGGAGGKSRCKQTRGPTCTRDPTLHKPVRR
jgi:hypothetical protein